MSLRLWAPLNGDLRQIGASNAVLTNDGATIDNNGKIGKCYSFANTHIIVDSTDIQNILSSTTQPFSMACWIYLNSDETDRVIIFGNYSANPFVNWELAANCTQRLCAGGTSNYANRTNSTVVPKTTWTHIAVTYNGATTTFYQNGTSVGSVNGVNTLTTKTASSRFYLGSDVRNDATRLKGKMNDFRFYDHCLSAAEVHEIAQGLVLHYPLNRESLKPIGTNLVTGVTKGGQTSLLTDGRVGVVTSGTSADTYFTVNLSESITSGTTYYLSCDVSGVSDGQYWGFPLGAQSNTSMPSKFYNGHNVYIFTANDINWGTNRLFLDDNYRNDYAHPASFYNFVLIKNPTFEEFDCSGYNYNGTSFGQIQLLSDTPRYDHSTQFASSADGIKIHPIVANGQAINELTVGCWFKTNTLNGTAPNIFSLGANGFCRVRLAGNSSIWWYTRVASTASGISKSCKTLTDNIWHHVAYTFKNGWETIYIDGVNAGENDKRSIGTTLNCNDVNVNNWVLAGYSATGERFIGSESDFRIYTTALTADDILALYHTSAKIDNKHKIHSFEFNENNQDKITKTGQLQGSALTEFNGMSYLKYDSNLYIEPDGSCWVRVFHHNNPGAGSFSSSNDFAHSVYIDENRWFNMELANYLNKWEIMVKGKFTATSDEWKLRWIQQYNPMTATYENVAVANVTKITNGYSSSPAAWGGLYFKNGSTYLCANNGTNGNWWGAVGSYSVYQGGIPGWGPSGTITTTGFNDVYLRIDNVTFTTPTAKNTKNKIWTSSQFIEL